MARPVVVIADPDLNYVAPLACEFLGELGDAVNLMAVTSAEYWQQFISIPRDIEALLVCDAWYGQHVDALNIAHLFVLCEDDKRGTQDTRNLQASYTFKYSSPEILYSQVLRSCARLQSQEAVHETKVLLFHTPVGGAGATTIALAMAACMSDVYRRVLYVDAESVQTFSTYLDGGQLASNEMARAMARNWGDPFQNLEPFIVSDGFDYLPALRSGIFAYGVDYDFFLRFVRAAKASMRYDYILVDTDGAFDENKAAFFELANQIVVPVTQDVHALYKVRMLVDNVDGFDPDRYHFVCNKYQRDVSNAFEDSAGQQRIVLDGYVEYDRNITHMRARSFGEVPGFKRLVFALS